MRTLCKQKYVITRETLHQITVLTALNIMPYMLYRFFPQGQIDIFARSFLITVQIFSLVYFICMLAFLIWLGINGQKFTHH